jgi:NADH dehydrogenase
VVVAGNRIEARTVIWGAGVAASSAAKWIGCEKDRAGRIKVEADLSVPGHPEIFAIGDTALALGKDGKPVPGVAPAAKQMGWYVAKLIAAKIAGQAFTKKFRYSNYGNLATIGRKAAVADFGWARMHGWPAWMLWGVAHVYFLIGFRNRLAVILNWTWAYFRFSGGVRLITDSKN